MQGKFIDTLSWVIGAATLIVSFALFYQDTQQIVGSLVAAVMTAALVWATYIVLRWLILANRG